VKSYNDPSVFDYTKLQRAVECLKSSRLSRGRNRIECKSILPVQVPSAQKHRQKANQPHPAPHPLIGALDGFEATVVNSEKHLCQGDALPFRGLTPEE
jgi:hypothetical protein